MAVLRIDGGNRLFNGTDSDDSIVSNNFFLYSNVTVNGDDGNDVIVNADEGSIKLLNVEYIDSGTVTVESSTPNLKAVILTDNDTSPYTAAEDTGTIDASARSKEISIVGNNHDNFIIGGNKADTLTGNSGNDTFVSSLGKDIITDYAEGDVVSLSGTLTKVATSTKDDDVTLTIGKGSFNLKNAKGKKVTIIDTAGNITKQAFGVNSIDVVDSDGTTINAAIDSVVETINASTRTQDVNISGNARQRQGYHCL